MSRSDVPLGRTRDGERERAVDIDMRMEQEGAPTRGPVAASALTVFQIQYHRLAGGTPNRNNRFTHASQDRELVWGDSPSK